MLSTVGLLVDDFRERQVFRAFAARLMAQQFCAELALMFPLMGAAHGQEQKLRTFL